MALGFGQRFIEQIAGLQCLQGLQEQRALLVEILRAGLRLEQRASGIAIVAARQGDAGKLAIIEIHVGRVAHAEFAEELHGGRRIADLARLRGQRLQIGHRPGAQHLRRGGVLEQAVHHGQTLHALGGIRLGRIGALLRDLDARAQDLARQVLTLHRQHAFEHRLGIIQPTTAGVLFGQHAHEVRIVGRYARPRLEIGHGQAIDGPPLTKQALTQGLAREHQRQPDPHDRGKGQNQRRRQQPLALRRRSGLRLVAGHGSDH